MSIRTFQATCTCGWSKSTDRNMLSAALAAGTVDAKVDGNAFAVALLAGTVSGQPGIQRHALNMAMVD